MVASGVVVSAPEWHERVADALRQDARSIRWLVDHADVVAEPTAQRVLPGLYWAAFEADSPPDALSLWQGAYTRAAGRWPRLRRVLGRVGSALDGAGVAWIPIKGLDTAERFFPRPELRPTSDLDVLVPFQQLERAMAALSGAGWAFDRSARIDRYQYDEGYNWHGRAAHGESLELHYRLWGSAPASLTEACWQTAEHDPGLGTEGHRLSPPMAFVVCAVHLWVHAGAPQLIYFWELKWIAETVGDAGPIIALAREHQLQLSVGAAAMYVAQLWSDPVCREIGEVLLAELRWPEKRLLRLVQRHGVDAMTLERMVLARMLARRPARMGWRSIGRRLWPHAGTVEMQTQDHLPWWRRRLELTRRNLGLAR